MSGVPGAAARRTNWTPPRSLASVTWDPRTGPFEPATVPVTKLIFPTWRYSAGTSPTGPGTWTSAGITRTGPPGMDTSRTDIENAIKQPDHLIRTNTRLRGSYQFKTWEDRITGFSPTARSGRGANSDTQDSLPAPCSTSRCRPGAACSPWIPHRRTWRLDPAPGLIDGDTETPVDAGRSTSAEPTPSGTSASISGSYGR